MGLAIRTINKSNEYVKYTELYQCLQSLIGPIEVLKVICYTINNCF